MQANRNGVSVDAATPQTVSVTRGWGDRRTVRVPLSELRNVHLATDQGGDRRHLPRPMIAAYMNCTLVPVGAPFGHSCGHSGKAHSIKVLIRRSDNDATLYAGLRNKAGKAKLWKGYRLSKRS